MDTPNIPSTPDPKGPDNIIPIHETTPPCALCSRLAKAPRQELDARFADTVKFTSGFFRKHVRQLATGKWQKIPLQERDALLWALAHASSAELQHAPESRP